LISKNIIKILTTRVVPQVMVMMMKKDKMMEVQEDRE